MVAEWEKTMQFVQVFCLVVSIQFKFLELPCSLQIGSFWRVPIDLFTQGPALIFYLSETSVGLLTCQK